MLIYGHYIFGKIVAVCPYIGTDSIRDQGEFFLYL
jgi:hypothetical protein